MCILNGRVERVLALPTDDALHITDSLIRVYISKGAIFLFILKTNTSLLLILINAASRRALQSSDFNIFSFMHVQLIVSSAV